MMNVNLKSSCGNNVLLKFGNMYVDLCGRFLLMSEGKLLPMPLLCAEAFFE